MFLGAVVILDNQSLVGAAAALRPKDQTAQFAPAGFSVQQRHA